MLDIEHKEWLTPTERLDDDNRPEIPQTVYAAWGSMGGYLGWQGADWDADGTMWAYYDLITGGTNLPVTGTVSLPFDADIAIMIDATDVGWEWTYSSTDTTWVSRTMVGNFGTAFWAHDATVRGTEALIDVYFLYGGESQDLDHHHMMAFAVDDNGQVWSAFPTMNTLDGDFNFYYDWPMTVPTDLLELPVGARQPYLTLQLESVPVQDTRSENENIQYVAKLTNTEVDPVDGVKLLFTGSSGLGYQSVVGEDSCPACTVGGDTWLVGVPTIAAGGTHVVTVTAQLSSTLAGINSVTTTVGMTTSFVLPVFDALSHIIDLDPPTVTVDTNPGNAIPSGPVTFVGTADDGFGTGVETVEVSTNGVDWQTANGTLIWSADVNVSAGMVRAPDSIWNLYMRARDYHDQTSSTKVFTFYVDTTPPVITTTVPTQISKSSVALISGETRDPSPDDARVKEVEMQFDSSAAGWGSASLLAADSNGEHDWMYPWSLPNDDGVTHTLRVRATDYGENSITTGWYTAVVDVVPPVVTVTQHITLLTSIATTPVLSGFVSDGLGVDGVIVLVYPDVGASSEVSATLVGGRWSYAPNLSPGDYNLYVRAQDTLGNKTAVEGPYALGLHDCWATPDNGLTVYTDAGAVQAAVDAVVSDGTVKVAGTCTGVEQTGGFTQTVYISKSLAIVGGYTHTNWLAAPNPDTYLTTLDAGARGRVALVSGSITVTLEGLRLTGGLADDGSLSDNGGGIWNNGRLTISSTTQGNRI